MLNNVHLHHLLCIDIETVPAVENFSQLSPEMQELYNKKTERLREEGSSDEDHYFNTAGIYAEFGKIICISAGIFVKDKSTGEQSFRIKSFSGDDEKKVLEGFFEMVVKNFTRYEELLFAGHNIKEFDVPYISRRALINWIPIPHIMDFSGKKPYEVTMVDTMQHWKFGDYKNYTSLKLLAALLGIESPKDDIEGKDVGRVYWKEKDLPRIVNYCQKDVVTVAQLILRYKELPLLKPDEVVIVSG
jgi:3'-5' exonuclease